MNIIKQVFNLLYFIVIFVTKLDKMDMYDKSHFEEVERNLKRIQNIFNVAIEEIARLGLINSMVTPELFDFKKLPQLRKEVIKIIQEMKNDFIKEFNYQTTQSWFRGEDKNFLLLRDLGVLKHLPKEKIQFITDPNLSALKAFQKRKTNNFSLSNRVWNIGDAFYREMEIALDLSLAQGKSAQSIARDVKKLLKEPDMMYRRYRDKHGNLVWSKKAQEYKSGKGVYKSSHKNAFRLARTENNIAYHSAIHEKYKELDFVVGIEIRLSNNPNHCPFCKAMAGKYQSNFKFTGWHPQCRCTTIPILKTEKEMDRDRDLIFDGKQPQPSKNEIKQPPKQFMEYLKENNDKINSAKTKPYYIYDNKDLVKNYLK